MNQLFEAYPDMMTVEQMAHALNIGRSMAYRLVHTGQIRSLRFGTAIRVPKSSLLAAVARQNEALRYVRMHALRALSRQSDDHHPVLLSAFLFPCDALPPRKQKELPSVSPRPYSSP